MNEPDVKAVVRKASYRLIPLLCLLYLVNYIDRINVSFAALTMNKSLGLSPASYGIGASIFFASYLCLEVPSSLMLAKFGARRWIARIMVTWGLVTIGTSFVTGSSTFFAARFLLGAAEAGFFPGILFYLTQWFPAAQRSRMVALFMVGMPLSGFIGAPLSTYLLTALHGYAGLQGWQWMFIAEGIPALVLGVACLQLLPDRPGEVGWLEPNQKAMLQRMLDAERSAHKAVRKFTVLQALMNTRVLLLALTLFCISSGAYGTLFWIPQLLKEFELSNMQVGLLAALPYLLSIGAMVAWSRQSDATGERVWHVVIPAAVSALGFFLAAVFLRNPALATLGLCIACVGIYACYPVFWTLPTTFLTGRPAAGAIALIVASGNISGLLAPSIIGWMKQVSGSFAGGMALLAIMLLCACVLTLASPIARAGGGVRGSRRALPGVAGMEHAE